MSTSDDFVWPTSGPAPERRRTRDARRSPHARRSRRERARRIRRRRLTALGVLAAVTAAAVLALTGGSRTSAHHTAAAGVSAATTTPVSPTGGAGASKPASKPAHSVPAVKHSGPSPGSLPQTESNPSGNSALFKSQMTSLWAGVVHDSVTTALPAFFPRAAYLQLKAIGSPGSDWRYRLVHDYAMDIAAAHRLLGSGASNAQLVTVKVVDSYSHWVPTGVCYNSVGYYEMPDARVVYREHGQISSFGIASMISWRGEWYVVHLGAVLREGEEGIVDEPSSGTGSSAYSGTC
jgi:hypothetical protein